MGWLEWIPFSYSASIQRYATVVSENQRSLLDTPSVSVLALSMGVAPARLFTKFCGSRVMYMSGITLFNVVRSCFG